MSFPKPQPPKSVLKPIVETVKESTPAIKRPFVRKPHLTVRPFADLKTQLDSSK